jgi:hypothetical protein
MEQHVNRAGKGDMLKNPLVGGKKGFKGGAKDPYSDGMPASGMGLKPNMEEVEYIDEAAVPDSHKQAMIKRYGRGRVTAKNGMISHTDKYGETNSHTYDQTKKQPIGRHVGTITVQEEVNVEEDYDSRAASSSKRFKDMADKDSKSKSPRIRKSAVQIKKLSNRIAKSAVTGMKEEVDELFSEAELDHMASVLEEGRRKPGEEPKKRGRKAGVKVGSYNKQGGSSNTEGSTEPKNLAAQIRFATQTGANDGKGNFMLKHPKTGETKAVPAKAATEFYSKYVGSEKPSQKEAHHDAFLAKHFGSSEKPASKSGITLPNIPSLRK